MSEKKEYRCRWCDPPRVTNCLIKELKHGKLVWIGCPDCFMKKKEIEKNAKERQ